MSRNVVMEGWYVPKRNLWRIPLVKNLSNIEHQSGAVAKFPLQILRDGPPPPTEHILSV